MNYAVETIRRAMKIYQEKHGGTLPEVSILFVNVMEAFDEAIKQPADTHTHKWVASTNPGVLAKCSECGAEANMMPKDYWLNVLNAGQK